MTTTRIGTHPALERFQGLGAAFYPEHHPREQWPAYADLLAQAGLRFTRMFEFAWDKLEPREGVYAFDWVDEVLDLLGARGIRALLCTPTATPPIWACEKYPEIFPTLEDGTVMGFGTRRYTCPTSLVYRELSARMAGAMGAHFGQSPHVLGWQIDNEFSHPFCHCPRCQRAFQVWCRDRFGTIEAFNDAVCAHFWGLTLTEFGQITLPAAPNNQPSLWQLAYQFISDVTTECFGVQVDALRAQQVAQPITTNMMITWYGYDHEAFGARLDVIGGDHYGLGGGGGSFGEHFVFESFSHAYLRGFRHGQNPWFHEFQCGRTAALPLPGRVRWEGLTQIGLGADLLSYFRFDSPPSGHERDTYALLGTHRQPGRIFHEIRALTADVATLQPLLDGTAPPPAQVGILYTQRNHVEFNVRNHCPAVFPGLYGNQYSNHLAWHYGAIARQNIPVELVNPGDDFTRFDVLIAPACYILPAALADKLRAFVAGGGTLLLTSLSGKADAHGRLLDTPAPGPLAEVVGVHTVDYGETHPGAGPLRIVDAADLNLPALETVYWLDELTLAPETETLARLDNPHYPPLSVFTRHAFGQGQAYYLGVLLDADGYNALYRALAPALGLRPLVELPQGMYASVRQSDDHTLFFLNNPSDTPRTVSLPAAATDALTGAPLAEAITVGAWEVRVVVKSLTPVSATKQ